MSCITLITGNVTVMGPYLASSIKPLKGVLPWSIILTHNKNDFLKLNCNLHKIKLNLFLWTCSYVTIWKTKKWKRLAKWVRNHFVICLCAPTHAGLPAQNSTMHVDLYSLIYKAKTTVPVTSINIDNLTYIQPHKDYCIPYLLIFTKKKKKKRRKFSQSRKTKTKTKKKR